MVIGWDIGGVNTKVARVDDGGIVDACGRPYELQRAPGALTSLLRELSAAVGAQSPVRHAVTMTAELSQMFRTKREGVAFVLDAVEAAFPADDICVFAVDGRFLSPGGARREPLAVAAANWSATAHVVARRHPNVVLVDVGTTTADVIPIVDGAVVARGRTDPDRLASGELVYTGALRTPVEAIVRDVPYAAGTATVSAEGFALSGDVHVWLGSLDTRDYTVPAPDGRQVSRELCGERLARVVCADLDLIDEAGITRIATAVAGAQVAHVAAAIARVASRHPVLRTAIVTGLGAFVAEAAARQAGLDVRSLEAEQGRAAARCAPAAAVALLLSEAVAHA